MYTEMYKLVLSCVVILFLSGTLTSQKCGTVLSELPGDYFSIISDKRSQKSLLTDQLPITFHIVEQVLGQATVTSDQLEEELDGLNFIFANSGVSFYMCGSQRYSKGEGTYDYTTGAVLNNLLHVPGTINVYYVDELMTTNLDGLCGFAIFPWSGKPTDRYAVVDKDCMGNGKVLAHEIGHFFGLLHTHETAYGAELVNRSNCEVAGDLLCDTPADPNLAFAPFSGCTYVGEWTDPQGDLYTPNPANVMSYAPFTCLRRFSDQQVEIAKSYIAIAGEFLTATCDDFMDFGIATSQESFSTTSGSELIIDMNFTSSNVSEGQDVELFIYLSENENELGKIIYRHNVFFDGSNEEKNNKITVKLPLALTSGQYSLTAVINADFRINELTRVNNRVRIPLNVDNSSFADILLFPNPATSRVRLFMRNSKDRRTFTVQFADVNGRIQKEVSGFKNEDEFLGEYDISELQAGWLVVSVRFESSSNKYSFLLMKPEY